jgi:superfamily II DNA/RNA helicase
MSNKKKELKYESFNDICEDMLEKINDDKKQEEILLNLFRGVVSYGFERPTPIQESAILPIYSGVDIIAQSQSGTGKTGAFIIGLLSRINPHDKFPQAIVLATTRELALQINSVCKNISQYMNIKTCLSIGGEYMSVTENSKQVKDSHIVIGTPGRINNIIDNGAFSMKNIHTLVLDEADALLEDDFIKQIKSIITKVNMKTQICVFSATMDENTLDITKQFSQNPHIIKLKDDELSLDIIKQYKIELGHEKYKIDTLFDLYTQLTITQAVIFANTVNRACYIHDRMKKDGHQVGLIHGKMTSEERVETLKRFRKGEIRVIIGTDVIARGIDVQQIGLVFNYDIPNDKKTYLHRIGRSGRYGKLGVAINFITNSRDNNRRHGGRNRKRYQSDYEKICDIQTHYKNKIDHLPDPDEINAILMG